MSWTSYLSISFPVLLSAVAMLESSRRMTVRSPRTSARWEASLRDRVSTPSSRRTLTTPLPLGGSTLHFTSTSLLSPSCSPSMSMRMLSDRLTFGGVPGGCSLDGLLSVLGCSSTNGEGATEGSWSSAGWCWGSLCSGARPKSSWRAAPSPAPSSWTWIPSRLLRKPPEKLLAWAGELSPRTLKPLRLTVLCTPPGVTLELRFRSSLSELRSPVICWSVRQCTTTPSVPCGMDSMGISLMGLLTSENTRPFGSVLSILRSGSSLSCLKVSEGSRAR
mmetsp:Transcript_28706/g.68494  ORF Transcript_28706/g.68494 Transcript_28706/m.68494 type:complete len:276 (-) Transcript_28706:2038-2865(-)